MGGFCGTVSLFLDLSFKYSELHGQSQRLLCTKFCLLVLYVRVCRGDSGMIVMMESLITYPIPDTAEGHTLARVVCAVLGVAAAQPVLAHGGVWLNGRRVRDVMQPATPGALLVLHRPPSGRYSDIAIGPEHLCYEDGWLVAVNKQPGWYTSPTPWDAQGHVVAALARFFLARDGVVPPLHNAHQLDRDTSGVLLCTRDPAANGPLQRAFSGAEATLEKYYLCVCAGEPPDDQFEVRTGHGRRRAGLWGVYPLEEVGRVLPNGKRVRLAHTSFTVVRRLGDAALLRARLHTGRTHQIRLHLAEVGCPLVGDARYGGPTVFRGGTVPFHLLHAARLHLVHPMTGEVLDLRAPLPLALAEVVGA